MLREAGLPHPGGPAVEKHPGDWVTAADLASESAILEVLAHRAPGIPVLAEETGGDRAGTMWAVDPLDGTRNYTRGMPVVGISVALIEDGLPLVGVVLVAQGVGAPPCSWGYPRSSGAESGGEAENSGEAPDGRSFRFTSPCAVAPVNMGRRSLTCWCGFSWSLIPAVTESRRFSAKRRVTCAQSRHNLSSMRLQLDIF